MLQKGADCYLPSSEQKGELTKFQISAILPCSPKNTPEKVNEVLVVVDEKEGGF